ncbi:MAG: hypothetical protein ACK5MN_03260 [Lachnospiraceae bacterium]
MTVLTVIAIIVGSAVLIAVIALAVWIWFAKKMFKHNEEAMRKIERWWEEGK